MSTVDLAADYANKLVEKEARNGDVEDAMRRIEAMYGVGYWSLWSFRYKRPKSVTADVLSRLRSAYLASCERQLANLQHEISIEKARGNDLDADLAAEAEALLQKIRARRAAG